MTQKLKDFLASQILKITPSNKRFGCNHFFFYLKMKHLSAYSILTLKEVVYQSFNIGE